MGYKLLKQSFILATVCIFGLFSCTKNSSVIANKAKIIPDSTSYSQYGIATMTSYDLSYKQTYYTGFIGDRLVNIYVSGNKLGFIVPEITPGTYSMQTTIDGFHYILSITVKAIDTIADANSVIQSTLLKSFYTTYYLDSITSLTKNMPGTSTTDDHTNVITIKGYTDQISNLLNLASPDEKMYLAKFITANKSLFFKYENVLNYVDTFSLFRKSSGSNFEPNSAFNIQQIINNSVYFSPNVLALNIKIAQTSSNLVSTFTSGINMFSLYNFNKLVQVITSKAEINSSLNILGLQKRTGNLTFISGKSYTILLNAEYRNLCYLDSLSPQPLIINLISSLKQFDNTWIIVSKYFSTPLSGNPINLASLNTVKTRTMPVDAKYLSVTNITNTSITSTYSDSSNFLKVKFTSSLNTDQNCVIDIVYNNTDFNSVKLTLPVTIETLSPGITIAGGNGCGYSTNQICNPGSVFVDENGAVFIADCNNNRVMKWLPNALKGITVAGGNGSGNGSKQLNNPTSVFVDALGNLYVGDYNNARVQKWAVGCDSGVTVAGGHGGGSAANQVMCPSGLFVDGSGNLFVSDACNNRVQKWTPGADTGITVAGGNGIGSASNQLWTPKGIFVDRKNNLYIADYSNNRIQEWALGATTGFTVCGGNGSGDGMNQVNKPTGIFVDALRNIYISEDVNCRVQKWKNGYNYGITVAGGNGYGTASDQFANPAAIFVDGAGYIYVSDAGNNRVQKWTAR